MSDQSAHTGYTDSVYTAYNGSFTVMKRRYNYSNDIVMDQPLPLEPTQE